jgi:hypothetical protein
MNYDMNKYVTKILSLKELIPIILLLIYIMGFARLNLYYKEFGINIEYYIGLNDIIFHTLSFTVKIISVFMINSLIILIFSYLLTKLYYFLLFKIIKKRKISNKILEKFLDIKTNKILLLTVSIIYIVLIILFMYCIKYEKNTSFFYVYFYLNSIILFNINNIKNNTFDNRYRSSTITYIILFLISFSTASSYKHKEILSKSINSNIEFELKNSNINNKDFNFIGETSEYLFLFHRKEGKSYIFNKSQIEIIKISKNKDLDIFDIINPF